MNDGVMSSPGRLAQLACVLEVMAPKPGNVHRLRDLPGLALRRFPRECRWRSAEPLDRAATDGVGPAVERAIEATRRLVATNTNLGMVLLLAPLAAVPDGMGLREGVEAVLEATTIDDAAGRLSGDPARPARRHGLGPGSGHRARSRPCRSRR